MTNNNNNIYNYIIFIRTCGLLIILCSFVSFTSLAQNQTEIQLANEYLVKGDKEKARALYEDLAKQDVNIPFIHNNYLNTMMDLGLVDDAHNYLKKVLRRDPDNIQYQMDVGIVYVRAGDISKADKYFKDLISQYKSNMTRTKMISDYLASRSLAEYSVIALEECRRSIGNQYLFCLELAMLYRVQGQKDKMVQEYLNYVTQSSANIQYVKNVMQALLTKPDELQSLESLLYDKVQKNPDVEVYSDLLIWVTMQQKNFYAAFIQARAVDRRYKKQGEKCMDVAKVALDNEDYDNAYKAYKYVAREYPSGPYALQAELGLIHTRDARVRKTYPVSHDSVRTLILDYKRFIAQYNDNPNSLDAQRDVALLFATYLDQKDEAISLLNDLVNNPRASLNLRSKSKLDLGDIYLLKEEPWESTLLYSQVEKSLHENPLGYEAKLKNAKLSFYKGDFRLAQEHLDILKEATTREIANDAMDLSMLIKENIAFDSVGKALKVYSGIELLLYQNKIDQALGKIQQLKQGYIEEVVDDTIVIKTTAEASEHNARVGDTVYIKAPGSRTLKVTFANHTILDDVYWLESRIRMQRGEFTASISLLQQILDEYGEDVLADDAYFMQGEIYDRQLNDQDKAMEIYREFLNKFPGSVYAAEARKRFRTLRGDFANPEGVQDLD